MPKILICLDRSVSSSTLVLASLIVQVAIGTYANAASVNGQASATAVGEVISQPALVFFQAPAFITSSPQAIAASSSSRLLYITAQPEFGGGTFFGKFRTSKSSLSSLIDVNAVGVATFSITGANTTSGVSVQFPVCADGTSGQPVIPEGTSSQSTTPDYTSLILPTLANLDGRQLAVGVGCGFAISLSDPLIVQISFN